MTEQAKQNVSKQAGLSKAQETKYAGLASTSARIRYLDSLSWTRSQIANKVGRRYQHVRNVLITPIKSAPF